MRRALTFAHRYVGLAIAGYLLIAALTGSIIVFERELDAALNPDLFTTRSTGTGPIPLDRLVAAIERDGRARVSAVELPAGLGSAAIFRVSPASADRSIDHDQVFVNPETGDVLGRRLWGGCCFARRQIAPFLVHFHYSLHLPGNIGLTLMGIVGLLWFLDSFTGLALAWPRGGRGWAGWRLAMSIKRGARGYRRHLDLHRAGGVWLWLLLATMAFTSIAVTFGEEIVQPLVTLVSPPSPSVFDRPAPPPGRLVDISYQGAIDRAEASAAQVMRHPRAVYASHSPGMAMFRIAVADGGGDPRDGLGPSWFNIDDRDGTVRSTELMAGGTAGDTFLQAQLPTHTGRIGHLPGRILVSLFGLAIAMLSATGMLIWWKKRRGRTSAPIARAACRDRHSRRSG